MQQLVTLKGYFCTNLTPLEIVSEWQSDQSQDRVEEFNLLIRELPKIVHPDIYPGISSKNNTLGGHREQNPSIIIVQMLALMQMRKLLLLIRSCIYIYIIKPMQLMRVNLLLQDLAYLMAYIRLLIMNSIILFLCLVVLAATQACPLCKWNACSTTWTGFQNCSECESGALAQFEIYLPGEGAGYTQIVGVCQPCPVACVTCSFEMLSPAMSIPYLSINCTQCLSGYSYNYSSGGCAVCSANCVACECTGDSCWATYCETCALGYTLNSSHMYPYCYLDPSNSTNATNTTSLQTEGEEQTSETSPSSHSGAIIGLSIWGAVMTVTAVVFVVLYFRQRDAKPSTLLGSETQVRQVTF